MNKKSIVILVVIAVAVGIIIATFGDASKYVSFTEAKRMYDDGQHDEMHVVGTLVKDDLGQIVGAKYNPVENPDRFEFMMQDSLNNQARIVLYEPRPTHMEKLQKVVVKGRFKEDGNFHATKLLKKCPSKYQDGADKVQQ